MGKAMDAKTRMEGLGVEREEHGWRRTGLGRETEEEDEE